MSLRRRLATAGVLPLLLASCTTGAGPQATPSTPAAPEVDVDVDTAPLRAAKQAAGIADCAPGRGNGPVEGGLPEVTLPCLGGGPDVDLGSLRGPLVVNVWAQWCGPCRTELPFYQRLHERAGDELSVLGVDYQDPLPDRALELLAESGVTYPSVADPAAQLRVPFMVRGLPILLLVDASGEVVFSNYVAIESYDQLRDLVSEHLDVTV